MIMENYSVASWVLTKTLAISYFFAFFSMSSQILGLYGKNGILSIHQLLGLLKTNMNTERYFHVPSLFWLNSSDLTLKLTCLFGMLAASFAFFGFAQSGMFLVCFVLYLSIVSAGQIFMNYQWDNLLLELGFLAIFFAPFNLDLHMWQAYSLHPILYGLCMLLLFKTTFLSGVVKLSLKDPHWRNGTALKYHLWTQPLPQKLALFGVHIGDKVLRFLTATVIVIEVLCPLLMVFDTPWKTPATLTIIFLQIAILFSGNFGFLNILVIGLSFLGLTDQVLKPENFNLTLKMGATSTAALTAVLILLPPNLFWIVKSFNEKFNNVNFLLPLMRALAPFRITSAYGFFGIINNSRHELVLQGSQDHMEWKDYSFHYKPQDQYTAPRNITPFMPRLDWQLWFAAHEKFEDNLWLQNFVVRLLDGSPQVYELIKSDPFAGEVPQYLRFVKRRLNPLPLSELVKPNKLWWQQNSEDENYGPIFNRDSEL